MKIVTREAAARIAELEAEVARLTAALVDASFRLSLMPQDDGDRSQEVVGGRRIAELEDELAGAAIATAHAQQGQQALFARIAELEAERDKLREALVNEVWDREQARRAVARIAELEAERDYNRTAHDSATLRLSQLTKHIAELEAAGLYSAGWKEGFAEGATDKLEHLEAERDTAWYRYQVRIDELEAEVARVRREEWGPSAAAARIAELEAERDAFKTANFGLRHRIAELEVELEAAAAPR